MNESDKIYEAFKNSILLQETEIFEAMENHHKDFLLQSKDDVLEFYALLACSNPKIQKRLINYLTFVKNPVPDWILK